MAEDTPSKAKDMHNRMVLHLSNSITKKEFHDLKHLFRNNPLTEVDIQEIKSVQTLFRRLQCNMSINYGSYNNFVSKLELIGRQDLCLIVNTCTEDIRGILNQEDTERPVISMDKSTYHASEGSTAFITGTIDPTPKSVTWKKGNRCPPTSTRIPIDNRKYFSGNPTAPTLVIKEPTKSLDEAQYQCNAKAKSKENDSDIVHLKVSVECETDASSTKIVSSNDDPSESDSPPDVRHDMSQQKKESDNDNKYGGQQSRARSSSRARESKPDTKNRSSQKRSYSYRTAEFHLRLFEKQASDLDDDSRRDGRTQATTDRNNDPSREKLKLCRCCSGRSCIYFIARHLCTVGRRHTKSNDGKTSDTTTATELDDDSGMGGWTQATTDRNDDTFREKPKPCTTTSYHDYISSRDKLDYFTMRTNAGDDLSVRKVSQGRHTKARDDQSLDTITASDLDDDSRRDGRTQATTDRNDDPSREKLKLCTTTQSAKMATNDKWEPPPYQGGQTEATETETSDTIAASDFGVDSQAHNALEPYDRNADLSKEEPKSYTTTTPGYGFSSSTAINALDDLPVSNNAEDVSGDIRIVLIGETARKKAIEDPDPRSTNAGVAANVIAFLVNWCTRKIFQ